jgi:hypothetical protein
MVYEAGDISRPQVIPHALGVRGYALADSPLRRGIIPANVSQKKYIAAMGNLAPHLSTGFIQETRPKQPRREFEADAYAPSEALSKEVQKQRQVLARKTPETAAQVIDKFAEVQQVGPREHPEYVLVGEGVKRNLSSATAIARALAEQPTAPTSTGPTPEHHFLFGGSLKQKKKLEKKVMRRERVMEANLYEKKQSLVDRNLEELQRLSMQQEKERGEIFIPVNNPAGDNPAMNNPVRNQSAGNQSAGKPASSRAASSKPTSKSTSAAVFAGVGVFLGLILVLAVLGQRKQRQQR